MSKDWIKVKKSFTEEQREALWQYFIDHSQIQKNGYYGIQFYIKNEDDFWKRYTARYNLEFSRYSKLEKQMQSDLQALRFNERMGYKMNEKIKVIENGSNIFLKFMLFFYRKTRNIISK